MNQRTNSTFLSIVHCFQDGGQESTHAWSAHTLHRSTSVDRDWGDIAWMIFLARFCGFSTEHRHLSVILFGEGWKSTTSLSPFITLWILVEFAGSSGEDILMIKVRTKREKRPKTWCLRFNLLTIKICTWDYKPWRLVLRCWFLISMNHEVMCGGNREIFVTIIEGSLQFDLIVLQLWNKITLSSRWPQASNHFK